MKEETRDTFVIASALNRLNDVHLPRALSLKRKVDDGRVLNDHDLKFLRRVLSAVSDMNTIVERNPEYSELRSKMVGLCDEIRKKSANNEKRV